MPDAVPPTPAAIPGLGPIRVRALHKSGFTSVESLRAATLAALAAVPGITEIKARYIHDYLAAFTLESILSAADPRDLRGPGQTSLTQWESHAAPSPVSPLTLEAAHALGAAITLLTSPHGVQLRNRLVSGFDRFGQECRALITEAVVVQDREVEKALRRLRRATERFIEVAAHQEFTKKDQGRLADELAELSAWIAGLRTESASRSRRPSRDPKDA